MKFWDTSALVPLVVDEPATDAVRQIVSRDSDLAIWMLTSVELMSTLGRLSRQAKGLEDVLPTMRSAAMEVAGRCVLVSDVGGVRRRAERLVGVHPLSAADALQLAAALVAAGDRPERLEFVTLDLLLARCARLEGFPVIVPAA